MAKKTKISYNVQDLLIGNPLDIYENPLFYGDLLNPLTKGLIFWLDADDESTYYDAMEPGETGSYIMKDKAVGGYIWAYAPNGDPLKIKKRAINNKPALSLNGVDHWLFMKLKFPSENWPGTGSPPTDGYEVDSGHTIFVVAQPGWRNDGDYGNPSDAGLISISDNGVSASGAVVDGNALYKRAITQHYSSSSGLRTYAYFGSGSKYRRWDWAGNPNNKPHIYVSKYNGGTSHSGTGLWVDGVGSNYDSNVPQNTNNCRYLFLGRVNHYWKGYIAEVLIFNTLLSGDETRTIENYLANKWGIMSYLPDGGSSSGVPFGESGSHWNPQQSKGSWMEVPKRLNRVQDFKYSFSQERQEIGVIGPRHGLSYENFRGDSSREHKKPTVVECNFSYKLDGGQNEKRLGFNVRDQIGESMFVDSDLDPVLSDATQGIHSKPTPSFVADILHNAGYYDSRNLYLITNNKEEDIHQHIEGYPNYVTGINQISGIADPEAVDYSVMCLQDCHINNYTVSFGVGEVPSASVSMTANNASFYSSGSGYAVPRFNKKRNLVESTNKKLVIPKHFVETNEELQRPLEVFEPGEISVSIQKIHKHREEKGHRNQKPMYLFEGPQAEVDMWVEQGGTASYHVNSQQPPKTSIQFTCNTSSSAHYMSRSILTVGKTYRASGWIWLGTACPNLKQIWINNNATWYDLNIIMEAHDGWVYFESEFLAYDPKIYLHGRDASGGLFFTTSAQDLFYLGGLEVDEVVGPDFYSDPVHTFVIDDFYTSDWGIVSDPGDHGWTNIRMFFDYGGDPAWVDMGATTSNDSHYIYQDFTEITVGKKYKIKGSVYIPSANPTCDSVVIEQGTNNSVDGGGNIVAHLSAGITNEWVDFDVNFTAEVEDSPQRMYFYGLPNDKDDYRWAGGGAGSYDFFRLGNIAISEVKPTFFNDSVQSFSIDLNLNRKTTHHYLGDMRPDDTPVQLPVKIKVDLSILTTGHKEGSLVDVFLDDADYNITLLAKKEAKGGVSALIMEYGLSGCKLDNVSENGSIGTNKITDLSFSTQISETIPSLAFGSRQGGREGLFVSGTIMEMRWDVYDDAAFSDRIIAYEDYADQEDVVYSSNPIF
jgi:hypothetical protein